MRSLLLCLGFAAVAAAQTGPGGWRSMFDGKTLDGWRETPFARHGSVKVEDGALIIEPGGPMTGVTRTGDAPKSRYEVRFEAKRVRGGDFFASVTFPVGDSYCTFVTGGWGGDIVGLSSINGWDASENETRAYFEFEAGRWYDLRLEVAGRRVRTNPRMDRRTAGDGRQYRGAHDRAASRGHQTMHPVRVHVLQHGRGHPED